ncbi:MAG TPA: hypothetical protein VER36_08940 [Flavisolibacter sp.]|nr:hypothetical protein [Flavisolibacter sp.]
MKKAVILLMSIAILQACSNNGGQTGVQNDGMKLGDTNGGRADTAVTTDQSGTDTAKGEHRVDISTRDTFKNTQ